VNSATNEQKAIVMKRSGSTAPPEADGAGDADHAAWCRFGDVGDGRPQLEPVCQARSHPKPYRRVNGAVDAASDCCTHLDLLSLNPGSPHRHVAAIGT